MAAADPGWRFQVTDADGNIGMPVNDNVEAAYQYKLYAGETYSFEFWAYDKAGWDFANGYISYGLTFVEGKHEEEGGDVEKVEHVVSENALSVGANTLKLDASAYTTVYEFEPAEAGTYTFTVSAGSVGYWGGNVYFLSNPNSSSASCQWNCTGVGQSAFIGVTGSGTVTLTISKTGEGEAAAGWDDYVNTHTPAAFIESLSGVTKVNIAQAHTAVLGSDGYYHLDSADGPVLYVDLKNTAWNFVDSANAAYTLRGILYDENGAVKYRYEFSSAMKEYAKCVSAEGYYPLTADLINFLQGYGNAQGWWRADISPFSAIKSGTANEDAAWMVLCRYEA